MLRRLILDARYSILDDKEKGYFPLSLNLSRIQHPESSIAKPEVLGGR
jgi:hypothetical protein